MMNQYIKKFWEESGYAVREESYGFKKEIIGVKWEHNNDRLIILPLYTTSTGEYYYNDSFIFEDEMLRIIKIKAFL